MSKQIKNIFSDTACPSQEMMLKYTSNLLKGEEKHAFERHLAGCTFCSDAMEGLSLLENKEVSEDLSILHKKIDIISNPERKAGYWPLAVAASISILLVSGTWFYLNERKETVAMEAGGKKNEIFFDKMPHSGSVSNNNTVERDSVKDQIAVQHYSEEEEVKSKDAVKYTPPVILEDEQVMEGEQVMKEYKETVPSSSKQDEEAHYDRSDVSVAGGAMSPAPAPALSSGNNDVQAKKVPEGNISQTMLAMVEDEFINNSFGVSATAEKKSQSRRTPSAKQEASKDKSLDDCPNCPKKAVSETAQSNLAVLSMDYAMKKYKMKEYEQASKQFEEIIKEDKEKVQTENAKIFNALSLVNLNRGEEALQILNNIIAGPSSHNTDAAKWIKASILISRKESIKAKVILEDLSNHVNPYQARAKEVLTSLK